MWSSAIIAGIPEDVFWRSSPQELEALFRARREKDREAYLRAGLVAATIVNVNRRRGARLVQPSDFIVEPPRPEDYMGVEEAVAMMDAWANSTNKDYAATQPLEGWESNTL